MAQWTIYLFVFISVVTFCESYTIIYKNSQAFCQGNRYKHIYRYLKENKHCFPLQWCDEEHCCVHECGAFPSKTRHISVLNTELIPPGAFADSDQLLHIDAMQQDIVTLASKSFVNLYALQDIYLSFNKIRYIQRDIFINVSVSVLDLSWNKLVYVDDGAFDGMPNLKVLNLTHNELSYIYAFPKDSVLTDLILSHNYLTRLVVSSVRYPKLKALDASYNNLTNVAITSKNLMQVMDFRNNELEGFDVFDIDKVEILWIDNNKIKDIHISICEHVNNLSPFPNPWDCSKFGKIRDNCNIITDLSIDISEYRDVCEKSKKGNYYEKINQDCIDDSTCQDDQICRNHQCFDPCKAAQCHPTSVCKTENHKFTCKCEGVSKRNPIEFQSPCYDVECFVDEDCPDMTPCNQSDHVCDPNKTISHWKASSVVRTYPWYYDEEDSVLGEKVYEQNSHQTEGKRYGVKNALGEMRF